MFGPFGWYKHWQQQQEAKAPDKHACAWHFEIATSIETCDAEGTKELGGFWYCDEHAADDKEYGRVKPYSL